MAFFFLSGVSRMAFLFFIYPSMVLLTTQDSLEAFLTDSWPEEILFTMSFFTSSSLGCFLAASLSQRFFPVTMSNIGLMYNDTLSKNFLSQKGRAGISREFHSCRNKFFAGGEPDIRESTVQANKRLLQTTLNDYWTLY